MKDKMDPRVVERDFAAIPNLVTEINRILDATEVNAYRDVLMQAEYNIELLQQILGRPTNRFTDVERTGINRIAACLLDCRRRLNRALERSGPTSSVNAVADDARFYCSPEVSSCSGRGRPR